MEKKQEASQNWKKFWENNPLIGEWDYTSEIVSLALKKEAGCFANSKTAEIGCGTGRISARMAHEGAKVSVIDISDQAIKNTRTVFAEDKLPLSYAAGSIFAIPLEQKAYHLVWNAGVVEHFSGREIGEALKEMAGVCAPDGRLVVLAPYRGATFYRIGKSISEALHKWPFGYEEPVQTLREYKIEGMNLKKEYSIGFFLILVETFRLSKYTYFITALLRKLFIGLHRGATGKLMWKTDRLFSSLLGGYLLVSVFQPIKNGQCENTGGD